MSRIGRKPIPVPQGVTVTLEGNVVRVKGPKGELQRTLPSAITAAQDNGTVIMSRPSDEPEHRALHGLSRTLVANMIEGVTNGYKRSLEIQGVGYKAEQRGKTIVLSVGYANQITVPIPAGVTVALEGPTKIHVTGTDKQVVGQFAANLRMVRKPEPYKGKGIRYEGEVVKIKPGKAFAGAGAK